ncbi:MAG: NAD+ synthase [Acidimicrobiaceae bacterium]|nr:NAD+ synthase [Acidimicrobiaceae bacterium]MYC43366.1 NAD+ synthase [Acidimicrobiaceae bacterium]
MASNADFLRVAVCQINPTVGDLDGNMTLALQALAEAEEANADVAVMPEMAITGYPPEDLVLRPAFVADCRATVEKFAAQTSRCAVVVGFADGDRSTERPVADRAVVDDEGLGYNSGVWNALAVCVGGRVVGTYHKRHLPNYDVFDELRHFQRGDDPLTLYEIAGVAVGVTVCEDSWIPDGPVSRLASAGARVVFNVNGSPFRTGKQQVREQVISERVAEAGVPVLYANLVGGQDELVFDGGSFVVSPTPQGPKVTARCERFAERVEVIDIELPAPAEQTEEAPVVVVSAPLGGHRRKLASPLVEPLDELAEQWRALELATRDYVHKSGFSDVCVGLSGGVDSSITATIAADALGASHVHGVLMPSRYSSDHSLADAEALAANLGIDIRTVAIEPAHAAFTEMLFSDAATPGNLGDLTDQNVQSRIRGVLLMALANEHGWLVLTTGNKSEAAVGYSTLYGDTAGAYAVIKDVWKLTVYELCRWRNSQGSLVIPEAVLQKAPSAELRPDQRDDQSLPPYEVLDPILRAYVEDDLGVAEIVELGLGDRDLVQQVCRLVDIAEFKRRQTPIGARLSNKAFGRDRRMPIVNRYRG